MTHVTYHNGKKRETKSNTTHIRRNQEKRSRSVGIRAVRSKAKAKDRTYLVPVPTGITITIENIEQIFKDALLKKIQSLKEADKRYKNLYYGRQ